MQLIYGTQNEISEWSYYSGCDRADPFNEISLDVLVSGPGGQAWRVPAYWAGAGEWRVRFAPPQPGTYTFRSECSDAGDSGLHGQSGRLEARAYPGDNPLLRQGALRVAATRRTLEHASGKPFFWLGDTWWMGLCSRLKWPEDFQVLAADRSAKGFSVVQIVAGLYPDMPAFDLRGANEAGFPWDPGYSRINPAYFDLADLRIAWLVRCGIVPCIVGCWGYYLKLLGLEKMKQHWRYLVARWGGYPVVWCLAGEAAMPYYLSSEKEADRELQVRGWTEMGRYLRQVDPYHHPITIHPTQIGREQVTDDSVLDINMLQTGHGEMESLENTVRLVEQERARTPVMPVLVGEVSYEGFLHGTGAESQRLAFWSAVLCGAAGHTYGANGIWQVNTRQAPYGPSPHGGTWGNLPWEEAYRLPGSAQLGLAKQLLERYPWWLLEPHPEWASPCGSPGSLALPFAAGIPGKLRLVYFYGPNFPWEAPLFVERLEPGLLYEAFFWNPRTGVEYTIGQVTGDAAGRWRIPIQPEMADWLLVLERKAGEAEI